MNTRRFQREEASFGSAETAHGFCLAGPEQSAAPDERRPRRRGTVLACWFLGLACATVSVVVPISVGAAENAAVSTQTVAERVFFDRLRDLVQEKQWADASRHIQQAQAIRPAPAWLTTRDAEVRLAQIRIGLALRDLPAMVTATRLYLNGDDARAHQVVKLAQENYAAGQKNAAITLVKEVVHRSPDFSSAQRLLTEWEPPAPERKPSAVTVPVAESKSGAERKSERLPPSEEDEATALLSRLRTSRDQGNVPGMLAAARLFLTGDRARSQKMLAVAREYFDRGDKTTAVALTNEVLRRTPDFPPARRLLAAFEAAEKK
jgi:hypothetical protein